METNLSSGNIDQHIKDLHHSRETTINQDADANKGLGNLDGKKGLSEGDLKKAQPQ